MGSLSTFKELLLQEKYDSYDIKEIVENLLDGYGVDTTLIRISTTNVGISIETYSSDKILKQIKELIVEHIATSADKYIKIKKESMDGVKVYVLLFTNNKKWTTEYEERYI
jgi:hypothetical protein